MKYFIQVFTATMVLILTTGCASENYSNGDRVGYLAKFSKKGYFETWKSWEGELNITQTGMNTSGEPFDFSIDNDNEPAGLVAQLDSAARYGWKVELHYHEVYGLKNVWSNRGHTDYFVTSCKVLDREPPLSSFGKEGNTGHVIDTVYVVVFDPALSKYHPQK